MRKDEISSSGRSAELTHNRQNSAELVELVQALQCGDSVFTIFPSVIYLLGIALLVHHIITMNIRPQVYRRVGRELLLQIPWQEVLILMLIYQCIRIWLSTVTMVNLIFDYYHDQLNTICPRGIKFLSGSDMKFKSFAEVAKMFADLFKLPLVLLYISTGLAPFNWINATNVRQLHPLAQTLLLPQLIKMSVCTCLAFIPLLVLFKLKERRPLPQFMLWMGPIRRDRSELGAGGYYLERPISENTTPDTSSCDLKRCSSAGDVNLIRPVGPRRLRARKSVSV